MKITFDDGSFIEFTKNNNLVTIIMSSKDPNNSRKRIVTSGDVSMNDFEQITNEIIDKRQDTI